MKILMVASECVPFIKVGGLADVVGTLPKFLKNKKIDVRIVIPKYQKIKSDKLKALPFNLQIPLAEKYEKASLTESKLNKTIPIYFIENNKFFNRMEVYGDEKGDYPDNRERFIFFSRAVIESMKELDFAPDVIHCHDWQTGLIPAYLKILYKNDSFFKNTKTLYTIHNIAYQGSFDKDTVKIANFPWKDFTWDKLEYFNGFNFMKIGIVYADMVSTVSPTYAKEILLTDKGRGMEKILQSKKNQIIGILNGIDYEEWNPETDPYIKNNFYSTNYDSKKLCKEDLQKQCNLPIKKDAFLMGSVSRLDYQKGYDLILKAIPKLINNNIQIIFLGNGDQGIYKMLNNLAKKYSDKIFFKSGFNNELAHKIYASSDAFLMPSNFEPCGLGQMIALSYGTIPIVHKTGGLADTIHDFDDKTKKGNGFTFSKYNEIDLVTAIKKSINIYLNEDLWQILISNAFNSKFDWNSTVQDYVKLYQNIKKETTS